MLKAVLFLLLLFCGVSWSQNQSPQEIDSPRPEQAKPSEANDSGARHQQAPPPPSVVVNIVPAPKTDTERADDARERHNKAELDGRLVDLTAELAAYTRGLFWATIALVFATACLSYFGWHQSRDMKASITVAGTSANAAKVSADASLLALRPWVSCTPFIVDSLIYTNEGTAIFFIDFIVKNVGRSPAMDVDISVGINLHSNGGENSDSKLKQLVAMKLGRPSDQRGLLLFPGDSYPFNIRLQVTREAAKIFDGDANPDLHFYPEIYALVSYTYPLVSQKVGTGLIRTVAKKNTAFIFGDPVPREEMYLSGGFHWNDFAT